MNLSEYDRKSVIAPQGELDLSNSWRIRSIVEDVLSRSTNDIIIDLRSVNFIDSAAIQEVVRVWRLLGRVDRKLTVRVTLGSQPQQVLHMLLFDSGLNIDCGSA